MGERTASTIGASSTARSLGIHGVEPPRAGHALELVLAALVELDARPGYKVLHCLRDEHLAAPLKRSFAVCETSPSPAPAAAATRAPITTARPATLPSCTSHSPVCTPARTSRPSPRTSQMIARAQRMARAGPSPAVSFSSPQ